MPQNVEEQNGQLSGFNESKSVVLIEVGLNARYTLGNIIVTLEVMASPLILFPENAAVTLFLL